MIYVDEPKFGGKNWCHMMTDGDIDELHNFAKYIGLHPVWFQDKLRFSHYDLAPSKRLLAISHGAIEVTSRELIIRCECVIVE